MKFLGRAAIGMVVFGGCATTVESVSTCEEAEMHFEACGLSEELAFPQTCDPAGAQKLLATDCDELIEVPKGDGCNPFLWWTCFSGGSSEREVWLRAKECGRSFGGVDCGIEMSVGGCALMTVESASGEEVAREHTNSGGNILVELEDGDYTLKLWTRDGDLAPMISGDPFSPNEAEGPAAIRFSVGSGERNDVTIWTKPQTGEEMLGRCADARGELAGSCDGQPLDGEEVEWSWFVTFDRSEGGDTVRAAITRPFRNQSVNRVSVRDLPVGEYRVNVHAMDIPSWARRNNPDYEDLLSRFGEGVVSSEALKVRADDVQSTISLDTIEVDRTCG